MYIVIKNIMFISKVILLLFLILQINRCTKSTPFKIYQSIEKNENSLLVMSYNIMMTTDESENKKIYPNLKTEDFSQLYRFSRIINEIKDLNADIVGLQECDTNLIDNKFKNAFHQYGYEIEFDETDKREASIAIGYKKEFLEMKSKAVIRFDDLNALIDENLKAEGNIAIVLDLYDKKSKKNIIVVNTHLYYLETDEYKRYAEFLSLINYLNTHFNLVKTPLIITGDLNSEISDNLMRYIYDLDFNFRKDYQGDVEINKFYMSKMRHLYPLNSIKLRSAYDIYNAKDIDNMVDIRNNYVNYHPEISYADPIYQGYLDYILYSDIFFRVAELLELPEKSEIVKTFLPNLVYPSDHLKISARLIFK